MNDNSVDGLLILNLRIMIRLMPFLTCSTSRGSRSAFQTHCPQEIHTVVLPHCSGQSACQAIPCFLGPKLSDQGLLLVFAVKQGHEALFQLGIGFQVAV